MKYILLKINVSTSADKTAVKKQLKSMPYGIVYRQGDHYIFDNVALIVISAFRNVTVPKEDRIPIENDSGMTEDERTAAWTFFAKFKGTPGFQVSFKRRFDSYDVGIQYTDGSYIAGKEYAGWAVAKLGIEDQTNGQYDIFSKQKRSFSVFSGAVPNGTNNIGELTAVRTAAEKFDREKPVQVIIADSEYAIQCQREWIRPWQAAKFRNSHKQIIANKDIIIDTDHLIQSSGSVVLFMWIPSHAGTPFNEMCDSAAKDAISKACTSSISNASMKNTECDKTPSVGGK